MFGTTERNAAYLADQSRLEAAGSAREFDPLRQELAREAEHHRRAETEKSYFRKMIDQLSSPYHGIETACTVNLGLKAKADDCRAARQKSDDAFSVLGGAIKSLALFFPGKLGATLTASTFAADEYKESSQRLDLLQGASKGMANRFAFRLLRESSMPLSTQIIGMGIGSRLIENALDRKAYIDEKFNAASIDSIENGISQVLQKTLSPLALGSDLLVFGLARGLSAPAMRIFNENAQTRTMAAASLFGVSSGLVEEANKQWQAEKFSYERLLLLPLARGAVSAALALHPGRKTEELERLSQNRHKTLDMEYKLVSLSNEKLVQLAKAKGESIQIALQPVQPITGVKLPAEPTMVRGLINKPETVFRTHKDSLAREASLNDDLAASQLRFIGRKKGADPESPWQLQLSSALDRSVESLLSQTGSRLRTGILFGSKPETKAIAGFGEPTRKVLGAGMQSIAVELANGAVLKISKIRFDNTWGERAFDARLLSQVYGLKNERVKEMNFYLQEPVSKASIWQYSKLSQQIEKGGKFKFEDPKPSQTGRALRADGETTVLIDYASTVRVIDPRTFWWQ